MSEEKPLYMQVAEALGWKSVEHPRYPAGEWWLSPLMLLADGNVSDPGGAILTRDLPRYDADWSATGPILARLNVEGWMGGVQFDNGGEWMAYYDDIGQEKPHVALRGRGQTPLIAVCHLILALHAAGRLGVRAGSGVEGTTQGQEGKSR